jgi:glycerate kinase
MIDRPQQPRVLIAPNPFKHCLSGPQVAAALARGFRRAHWQVDALPLADGGPGTLDALQAALGGKRRRARVKDALGRRVSAAWLKLGPLAIIESAQAIGLERLGQRRRPLLASSEGLGQLLLAAQRAGCREAWVGLGGSASTDGGTGMARALGWIFQDAEGQELAPGGGSLAALAQVQAPAQRLRLKVRVLCDVQNPLYGAQGAAWIFGPQKGADRAQILVLEKGLRRLAQLHAAPRARQAGAGAAGGLGYGLMAFAGARLRPGAEALLRLTGFAARLRRADLVVSGEGRLDAQTWQGKLPARVLAAARKAGKPCVLVVGELQGTKEAWKRRGAKDVVALRQGAMSQRKAMKDAEELLAKSALRLGTRLGQG